jgi:2-polyprenyl-6-methoxyphenol hydroxylase-like FAD-dependent oxidoreductase
MNTTIVTKVIIVGAGPTGLSLACQLVRYGIDFVIIDKKSGVTQHSKALGVQARTLEIYEQLGIAKKALNRGQIAGKIHILTNGKVRGGLNLSAMGQGLSSYPYLFILEQSENERLLYEYLQSHHKQVLWQTELDHFSQDEKGVTAQVKTAHGAFETIAAQYLVGCDGAKSPVRHQLGLSFEGSTLESMFYVVDAKVDWALRTYP